MTTPKTTPGTAAPNARTPDLARLEPSSVTHEVVLAEPGKMAGPGAHTYGFGAFHDIPIELVFEVGRLALTIGDFLGLRKGTIVDLSHVAVDAIEISIDRVVIGHGEMITFKDKYGVRVRDIAPITDTNPEPAK